MPEDFSVQIKELLSKIIIDNRLQETQAASNIEIKPGLITIAANDPVQMDIISRNLKKAGLGDDYLIEDHRGKDGKYKSVILHLPNNLETLETLHKSMIKSIVENCADLIEDKLKKGNEPISKLLGKDILDKIEERLGIAPKKGLRLV